MNKLSIIIPSYNELYLDKTIQDILKKAEGDIEIFVNLDGNIPKKLVRDKRVHYTHHQKPIGMRGGINEGLERAKSKFIMKCDAHCAFAKGFDEALKRDCQKNWLMIPRRHSLNTEMWTRPLKGRIRDYHYFCYPSKTNNFSMTCPDWSSMTRRRMNNPKYDIDDTMAFQGSCWFAHKDYFLDRVGLLDDNPSTYGGFAGDQLEIGLKYWLKDGEVKVNKKTWYAHLHKNRHFYAKSKQNRKFKAGSAAWKSRQWSTKHWIYNREPGLKHSFQWLLEKFWPVQGWPKDRKLWKI